MISLTIKFQLLERACNLSPTIESRTSKITTTIMVAVINLMRVGIVCVDTTREVQTIPTTMILAMIRVTIRAAQTTMTIITISNTATITINKISLVRIIMTMVVDHLQTKTK